MPRSRVKWGASRPPPPTPTRPTTEISEHRPARVHQMNELLNDKETYSKKSVISAGKMFNPEARKVMKKRGRGEATASSTRGRTNGSYDAGIPKLHKSNIPVRPITSGIVSAPHRLAKLLAKQLSRNLGAISDAHLRNSGGRPDRQAPGHEYWISQISAKPASM